MPIARMSITKLVRARSSTGQTHLSAARAGGRYLIGAYIGAGNRFGVEICAGQQTPDGQGHQRMGQSDRKVVNHPPAFSKKPGLPVANQPAQMTGDPLMLKMF